MKKILITGGNGFIGSHLARNLLDKHLKPTLLLRSNSDTERLQDIINLLEVVEADLSKTTKLKKIIQQVKPEIIFHLASYGVYSYTDFSAWNTDLIYKTNLQGTINLLHLASEANCKVFINTGSCFEYGSKSTPFFEESSLNPKNIYGVSKVATTLFAKVFSENTKMAIVTVRPFTVYGPGEDERRFISTTIKRCLNSQNPKLTTQKIIRDYIFIEDVIDAYLLSAQFARNTSGEIINISTGLGNDLETVSNLIMKLTGAKDLRAEIGRFPTRKGEALTLIGAPEKAKRLLGWKAKYSLEDGLKKTIDWIKTNSNY